MATSSLDTPALGEGPARPDGTARRIRRLASDYYRSEERLSAWLLTGAVLALTVLQIAVQVRINLWNRDFFDALEHHRRDAFLGQMGLFVGLALAGIAAAVLQLQARQELALRWRHWLVERLQRRLLADSCHYRLGFLPGGADNPDQRIGENTRWATAMAVELAVGLLHSVLLLLSFGGILWSLSGPLAVPLPGGGEAGIPGSMVWAALLYAALGTWLTWLVGRSMVGINARRNEAEGSHRFALVRLRENAEGVALIRGEADEARGLGHAFGRVTAVMRDLNRVEVHLTGLGAAYGMVTHLFPLLVASPRYFAGAISLGVLMQIASAFGEVTRALTWFMANYPRLADWASHVERTVELEDSLEAAARAGGGAGGARIEIEEGPLPDGREVLRLGGLSVATPEGAVLIRGAEAEIRPGERVLIAGESGTGKSTLFRAIAGAWGWGSGRIRTPDRSRMMFMPQRPYLPLGTLRTALAYPAPADAFPEAAMRAALERCGLPRLAHRLEEAERWDRILSLGEQQRLAFARMLLHRPRWVLMDEATAALDEASQEAMMRLFREELAGSALVSIAHRPGLDAHHDRSLTLVPAEGGARLRAAAAPGPVAARPDALGHRAPGLAVAGSAGRPSRRRAEAAAGRRVVAAARHARRRGRV